MNTGDRVRMQFSMPLSEIILDFYDKLKQITSGYARYGYAFDNGNLYIYGSLEYEEGEYREAPLVKVHFEYENEVNAFRRFISC